MSENAAYDEQVRTAAISVITEHGLLNEADAAAAADLFIARGFGTPGTGFTGRVVANTIRKVRPVFGFQRAKLIAGALNQAGYQLTGTEAFDKAPYRCTHCGDRFRTPANPRTHFGGHTTVFDPRTF